MQEYEFGNIDEMWVVLIGDLLRHGKYVPSRNGDSRELIGWSGKLLDVQRNFLVNEVRAADPRYACAELLWYLSRSNDTTMLQAYAPSYVNYTEDGVHAYGAYGHRIATNIIGVDQLEAAVERLKEKNTRQCVITLWKPSDLVEKSKDHPCTLTMQFLLRDDQLHLVVNMRSNDAWLGAPYDWFTFTCIQMLMAGTLGCKTGTYTHNVGSMHLYDKNIDQARKVSHITFTPQHGWLPTALENVQSGMILESEAKMRKLAAEGEVTSTPRALTESSDRCNDLLAEALKCCAHKHGFDVCLQSPALRKGLENVNRKASP